MFLSFVSVQDVEHVEEKRRCVAIDGGVRTWLCI